MEEEEEEKDLFHPCTLSSHHLIGYDDAGASLQVHAEVLPPEGELTPSAVVASHCVFVFEPPPLLTTTLTSGPITLLNGRRSFVFNLYFKPFIPRFNSVAEAAAAST